MFAGNTHDSTTVKQIVEAMERKHGSLSRVWVMDRGTVSEEKFTFLRERGGKYIVWTLKVAAAAIRASDYFSPSM